MFCSNCGKGEQTPNAYCRNCGEWLFDVNSLSKRGRRGIFKQTPEKRLRMIFAINLFSAVFALAITFALIKTFAQNATPPAIAMAIAFSVVIAAWQIVGAITAFQLRREMLRRRSQPQTNQLDGVHTTNDGALPAADTSQFVRPQRASVTESTTELLEPVLRER